MNELRPSTLGEILDRTANLYRSKFLVFFGIASVPACVVLGFAGLGVLLFAWAGTSGAAVSVAVVAGMVVLGIVGLPLIVGSHALSGAALCGAASALSMGETISIRSAFQAAWRRGWQYVGLYLLLMVIILVAPGVVWVVLTTMVAALAAVAGRGAAAGLVPLSLLVAVSLGLAVYAVWMLLRLCLAFPAAVVEQAGVGAALVRASHLSKGTRGRILVLFVLGIALGWVASLLLLIPMTIVMALMPSVNSPEHAQMAGVLAAIGIYGSSFVVQSLTWPVYAIALVLFYYDQRVRREGFDIELLMQRAGMGPQPVAQTEPTPWLAAATQAGAVQASAGSVASAPEAGGEAPAGGEPGTTSEGAA